MFSLFDFGYLFRIMAFCFRKYTDYFVKNQRIHGKKSGKRTEKMDSHNQKLLIQKFFLCGECYVPADETYIPTDETYVPTDETYVPSVGTNFLL